MPIQVDQLLFSAATSCRYAKRLEDCEPSCAASSGDPGSCHAAITDIEALASSAGQGKRSGISPMVPIWTTAPFVFVAAYRRSSVVPAASRARVPDGDHRAPWTIAYALTGSLPGLALMLLAHRAGHLAGVTMAGGLIIGFTVLSAFTATRVYLSEQFPTALLGAGTSSASRSGSRRF
jgi:hypothetical protein